MSNKLEIVHELKKIGEQIDKLLPQVNTYDAVITLLSFLEILSNEVNMSSRRIIEENRTDILSFIGLMDSIQGMYAVFETIDFLLKNSNDKQILDRVPPMESLFFIPVIDNPASIARWMNQKYRHERGDYLYQFDVQLPGDIFGKRCISLQKFFQIPNNMQILVAIKFFEYFIRKKSFESILRSGSSIGLTEDKRFLESFPVKPEELVSKGIPRIFKAGHHAFPLYKDKIEQISQETLISTKLKADVPLQQELHDKEHLLYFNEFLEIPNFSNIFYKKTGVSLGNFRDITLALKNIAKSRDTAVIIIPKRRLIKKIRKLCRCKEKEIEKVIDLLILKRENIVKEKGIIFTGSDCIFSWTTIGTPLKYPLLDLFTEFVDGNFAGTEFEKECRNVLCKNSCTVLDDRLEIFEPIIPKEISLNLWGRIKKRTDIDVVGIKNNILLIVECKSELPKFHRKERQLHEFEKYYEELQYKARWLTENFMKFRDFLTAKNFEIPNNVEVVIPFLASSFVRPENHNILTVTLKEFGEIIRKLPTIVGESVDVVLNESINITLPVYKIKKNYRS